MQHRLTIFRRDMPSVTIVFDLPTWNTAEDYSRISSMLTFNTDNPVFAIVVRGDPEEAVQAISVNSVEIDYIRLEPVNPQIASMGSTAQC